MFIAVHIIQPGALEGLFVSIPESLGVLAFGIAMIVIAVLIRRLMGRNESDKSDRGVTKKA
ncbi:MAG: hypothetical protein WBO10_14510 [Pyrinomonadaceae bacterium]